MKKTLIILTPFLLLIIYYSCKENTHTKEEIPKRADEIILDAKEKIKLFNLSVTSPNFNSQTFEQLYGYPEYQKAGSFSKETGQDAVIIPLRENTNSNTLKNILVGITKEDKIYYGIPEKNTESLIHVSIQNVLTDNYANLQQSFPGCPPFYVESYEIGGPCFPCCIPIEETLIEIMPISSDGSSGGGSSSIENNYYLPYGPCPFALIDEGCMDIDSLIYGELAPYPCAYDMVTNFVGLNDTLNQLVNNLFGLDKDVNVYFHISNSLPLVSMEVLIMMHSVLISLVTLI